MFQEPLGFKNSKVIEILDFFKVLNDDKISLDEVMKLTNTFNLKEKNRTTFRWRKAKSGTCNISIRGS